MKNYNIRKLSLSIIYVIVPFIISLQACTIIDNPSNEKILDNSDNRPQEPYLGPSDTNQSQQLNDETYPQPLTNQNTKTVDITPIPIKLNKPCKIGSKNVDGTGPPNIPINIIDVTFMGDILGHGNIDSNGHFQITVKPMEENHRIGISIGKMENSKWENWDFTNKGFNGTEAIQVPLVGFFYDSCLIMN